MMQQKVTTEFLHQALREEVIESAATRNILNKQESYISWLLDELKNRGENIDNITIE